MKTLGLIGGISCFSTEVYYRTINRITNERLGNSHSAKIILHSIDFEEYKILQEKNDWKQLAELISSIVSKLENAGADCIMMCSNTPHIIADSVVGKMKVPFIHIAEETEKEISKQKLKKVGLIGTKVTMENSFFTDRLSTRGIESFIPDQEDRNILHSYIINEFTKGIYNEDARMEYMRIITKLIENGAEGIVFGCTEIALLLDPKACEFRVFDTTEIHSNAAVDFALD